MKLTPFQAIIEATYYFMIKKEWGGLSKSSFILWNNDVLYPGWSGLGLA
jgi:hypothetical protein